MDLFAKMITTIFSFLGLILTFKEFFIRVTSFVGRASLILLGCGLFYLCCYDAYSQYENQSSSKGASIAYSQETEFYSGPWLDRDTLFFHMVFTNNGPDMAENVRVSAIALFRRDGRFWDPPGLHYIYGDNSEELDRGYSSSCGSSISAARDTTFFRLSDSVIVVAKASWSNPIGRKKSPIFKFWAWSKIHNQGATYEINKNSFIEELEIFTQANNNPFFDDYIPRGE